MSERAMIVTTNYTYLGDRDLVRTPTRILTMGIVDFVTACWGMLGGDDATVLIGGVMANHLRLPADKLPAGEAAKDHPAAKALRAAGFGCKEIHRWTHITRGGRTLHIGLAAFIDAEHMTIKGESAPTTVKALDEWYRLIRAPWTGDTGDSINTLIRETGRYRAKGRNDRARTLEPHWWDKGPQTEYRESAYSPRQWSRTQELLPFELGFDKVRAYLSAWTVTEVASSSLRRSGRIPFDKSLAGWWLVRPAPWQHEDVMPDPAGYAERDESGCVWLTTPRLVLLDELAAADKHGGFEVYDSRTAPAKANILKPAAERLRDAWDALRGNDSDVADLLRASIKEGYRMAGGKWCSTQSEIQRADWWGAVTAMSAVNTWRKAWEIGNKADLWPLRIDTDNIWYASADPDHEKLAQQIRELLDRGDGRDRFPLGDDKLGSYRVGGIRERTAQ